MSWLPTGGGCACADQDCLQNGCRNQRAMDDLNRFYHSPVTMPLPFVSRDGLTEDDVRRIVREELARQKESST